MWVPGIIIATISKSCLPTTQISFFSIAVCFFSFWSVESGVGKDGEHTKQNENMLQLLTVFLLSAYFTKNKSLVFDSVKEELNRRYSHKNIWSKYRNEWHLLPIAWHIYLSLVNITMETDKGRAFHFCVIFVTEGKEQEQQITRKNIA